MDKHLLEIKNLKVSFHIGKKKLAAVENVGFSLDRGKIIGIVGESGCGKSVTATSILRLVSPSVCEIDAGSEILFNGEDLSKAPEARMREIRGSEISMIFQEPMSSLNPVYRISDQMMEMLRTHDRTISRQDALARCVEMLRRVGIPSPEQRVKEYPHQLSGGMRQRVMIAMALACKPDILIADEPTTALDVTIQAQILRLMNDLQKENGTAIMFITHDLGVINEMADDVVVMYCGQVVEQAPARLIFTDCEKSHPYTEGLMYSIPRLNDERAKLDPIPGVVPHPLDLPQGCKFAPRCRYCTGKCIREEPELLQVAEGQLIRCFYPDKMERRSEKHGKNTVHGQREDH